MSLNQNCYSGRKIVYIASHIQKPIDYLRSRGYTVLCTDQFRSQNADDDWTEHYKDPETEYADVLVDTLLLSKCNTIIGGRSNVLFASSWLNPNNNIQLINFTHDSVDNSVKGYGQGGIR